MPRDYPKYDGIVKHLGRVVYVWSGPRKRQAIRTLNNIMRNFGRGAQCEVRVTLPGKKRGTLIYQAHINAKGKRVAEEL